MDNTTLIFFSVVLNFLLIYIVLSLVKRIATLEKTIKDIIKLGQSIQKMPKMKPIAKASNEPSGRKKFKIKYYE